MLFPHDITIEECRQATLNFPGFRETKKDDYISFNYDFAFRQTFPDPKLASSPEEARLLSVRRECRGIIYHAETGTMLARRLHKFFNINEMDETTEENIDLTQPHYILEKADGCLVSPFMSLGKLRFGSKGGITDLSNFIERSFIPGRKEMDYWIDRGYTPLFELCAQKHQVIMEYAEDKMLLIAIRENKTGLYLSLSELIEESKTHNVEPINWQFGTHYTDARSLLKLIKSMDNLEGFVICFEDGGTMYKAKSDWYISRSKKSGECAFFEKDIWQLVLDGKIDDYADALGRLESIGKFGIDLFEAIKKSSEKISAEVDAAHKQGMSKKDFVTYIKNKGKENGDPLYTGHFNLFFSVFDSGEAYKTVLDTVKKNVSSAPKLESVRNSICNGLSISLNEAKEK